MLRMLCFFTCLILNLLFFVSISPLISHRGNGVR
jgi:uncharacterized membrane protein